ncbi:MAG: metallophosphoesterase [Gammaproteobacteria bacterium]|nr:metallophosphoesterase [Gammaproteobacteria bacterium]
MRYLVFATVFLLVMGGINYYIYRRFLSKISTFFRPYAAIIPAILMLGELFFLIDAVTNFIPDSPALYLLLSAFIGISFILFVMALVYDLIITASSHVPLDQERRRFIKIIFDITMLIAAISYVLRGLSQGLKAPVINTVQVKVKDFPAEAYSIVQLTDVHVGRTIRRDYIEDLVARTNALNPDMVVITGDLIDLPVEKIRDDLAPLGSLQAPAYFVLGNHEYFHGPHDAIAIVLELGIRPLLNESLKVDLPGGQFELVGITDLVGERMGVLAHDLDAAFSRTDEKLPSIVLAHQPKTINLIDGQRCDLMISGHTHGGQIFPFGYLVIMDQPYLAGLHRHNDSSQIFVSRGTGFWGPPLRVLAPSEISLIQLAPA